MVATDWRTRCPHGHTNVKRRLELDGGGFNGRPARSAWYCRTCKGNPETYGSPHYHRHEMDTQSGDGSNVDLGHVWSPSHDD